MYYIQYYERNSDGDLWEPMGTDSVFILDGRNTITTMILDGHKQAERLKNVCPHYESFQLMKGPTITTGRPITPSFFTINR